MSTPAHQAALQLCRQLWEDYILVNFEPNRLDTIPEESDLSDDDMNTRMALMQATVDRLCKGSKLEWAWRMKRPPMIAPPPAWTIRPRTAKPDTYSLLPVFKPQDEDGTPIEPQNDDVDAVQKAYEMHGRHFQALEDLTDQQLVDMTAYNRQTLIRRGTTMRLGL